MAFLRNFFNNLLANVATQLVGVSNMIGALIFSAVSFFLLKCIFWHRRSVKEGRKGLEPSHLIIFGLIGVAICSTIAASGYIWQQFSPIPPTQQQEPKHSPADFVVLNPALEGGSGGSEAALLMTGTFAKGGKSIKFAIDVLIDTQNRGPALRRVPRIKIGEVNDFVKGQAVNVILVSYFSQDQAAPMWGPRRALSGINDETFQFTSFAKAEVFAIDEDNRETRVFGFTLLPKISGAELINEMARRTAANPTWRNFLICPDGTLQNMDSIQ
jgi:hypothetical protein